MVFLRLSLLWTMAAAAATATTNTEQRQRHLQDDDGIQMTLNEPYEHQTELLKDTRQIFSLNVSPDDIGRLISCSVMADNGDVDMEVGLDEIPDVWNNACTSISDDSDESCPVLIKPNNKKVYVLVKAQQRTTDFTVLCEHEDVTPLTIGQASKTVAEVEDGTYLLFSLPVPEEDDGDLLCTAQGSDGDFGLRASLDSLSLSTQKENPTKACSSITLQPTGKGSIVQACNVTATEEDKYLYVYVKAFQSSYDVSVTCHACEAQYYPGLSRIGYGEHEREKDETMRCVGDGPPPPPNDAVSPSSEAKPKYKSEDATNKSGHGGFLTFLALVAVGYGSFYMYRQKKEQQQYQHHQILHQHDTHNAGSSSYYQTSLTTNTTETELPMFR